MPTARGVFQTLVVLSVERATVGNAARARTRRLNRPAVSLLGAVLVAILSGCGHSAHTLPTPSELPRSLKGVEVTSRLNDSLYRQTLRGEWDYEMHGEPHHK